MTRAGRGNGRRVAMAAWSIVLVAAAVHFATGSRDVHLLPSVESEPIGPPTSDPVCPALARASPPETASPLDDVDPGVAPLPHRWRLRGLVRDDTGPIADARLTFWTIDATHKSRQVTTESNDAGTYRVTLRSDERLDGVHVVATSTSTILDTGLPDRPSDVTFDVDWDVVLPAATRITGRTLEVATATPLANVRLEVEAWEPDGTMSVIASASSDEDGRFAIPVRRSGSVTVRPQPCPMSLASRSSDSSSVATVTHGATESASFLWPIRSDLDLDLVPGRSEHVGTIDFAPAGEVALQLLDSQGRALAHCHTKIICPVRQERIDLVPTDAAGRTSAFLPPGRRFVRVDVSPEDHSEIRSVEIVPGSVTHETFRFSRELRQAHFSADAPAEKRACSVLVFDIVSRPVVGADVQWGSVRTRTDGRGRARLAPVADDIGRPLEIRARGYRTRVVKGFEPGASGRYFRLESATGARFVIVTSSGDAVSRVELNRFSITRQGERRFSPVPDVSVADDGIHRIDLGRHHDQGVLLYDAVGRCARLDPNEVTESLQTVTLSDSLEVDGEVVDAEGRPIEAAYVTAYHSDVVVRWTDSGITSPSFTQTRVRRGGRFRLRLPADGARLVAKTSNGVLAFGVVRSPERRVRLEAVPVAVTLTLLEADSADETDREAGSGSEGAAAESADRSTIFGEEALVRVVAVDDGFAFFERRTVTATPTTLTLPFPGRYRVDRIVGWGGETASRPVEFVVTPSKPMASVLITTADR